MQDEPDIALSPREEYAYDGYEYDLEEDNDDIENLPLLSPGEAYYEETCYSAPDVVASIKNSEYSLSIFHDALYTTGIIGKDVGFRFNASHLNKVKGSVVFTGGRNRQRWFTARRSEQIGLANCLLSGQDVGQS